LKLNYLALTSMLSFATAAEVPRYNILSLDGAKYKGYMTATFVEYMERNAYTAARRDYCLPKRDSRKVAMPELFDLIAGSETGAIIASTLVLPNLDAATNSTQKNEHFAATSK
jgi:patatin-like phospholipase/acyl hydrolase